MSVTAGLQGMSIACLAIDEGLHMATGIIGGSSWTRKNNHKRLSEYINECVCIYASMYDCMCVCGCVLIWPTWQNVPLPATVVYAPMHCA